MSVPRWYTHEEQKVAYGMLENLWKQKTTAIVKIVAEETAEAATVNTVIYKCNLNICFIFMFIQMLGLLLLSGAVQWRKRKCGKCCKTVVLQWL